MSHQQLTALAANLSDVMARDRYPLQQAIQRLQKRSTITEDDIAHLQQRVDTSRERVSARARLCPAIEYPEQLPIVGKRADIAKLIQENQVVILAGETGSGKTTQLPKICLDIGRGQTGLIGHTQPRRIAARTVASRIAEELHTTLGDLVGYQVRFSDQSGENTLVKLMTDGILLAEIAHDRYLNRYDTLIIDEAHERSLNIDFLLGYLKRILPQRPDLKVIVTSATIDLERFSAHFDDAPIVEVSGRTFPVEMRYRPPVDTDSDLFREITDTVEEILTENPRGGDILVFLSGEGEIREAAHALRRADFPHLDVLPLYARLGLAEQNRVFNAHSGRRVVLATNVAETSITVPGIQYVIDPGFARISRYSFRSKIQRLPIEPISQASANQRAGRCGRVQAGICYRLYDEQDFQTRPEFTDAEILRTNLAAVILQMLNLRIGDVRKFPFVDPPDNRLINDGFKLLEELQAVDRQGKVTKLGKLLMPFPVDPSLSRMLVEASAKGCLREMLIIVSALSVQDPRERPAEKQQAADEKHRRFKQEKSDFMSWLALWDYVEEQRQELTQNQFRRLCGKEFLSFMRLREWREVHRQLVVTLKPLNLHQNRDVAGYEAIHRALLVGLLGNIGVRGEDKEFIGARNRKFHVFPGSFQAKKPPRWLVAGQLLETSRVFAHQVGEVDPQWILEAANHLVKRKQFEPHYDVRAGQVVAYERVSLYGLTLQDKRRVSLAKTDAVLARSVFIRVALVEGLYRGKGKFFKHNQRLIADIQDLEAKSRRRDILVDDETVYQFYDERLPADVVNLAGFEHWRKQQEASSEKDDGRLLFMDRSLLMRHDAEGVTEAQFPKRLDWQEVTFPLDYHFEPGSPNDGVSLRVPVAALHLVPEQRLDWLVPGLLRDKCVQLVKALPKQWRKHFVPVPAYVDKALARLKPSDTPLTEALAHQLLRETGVQIPAEAWQTEPLDDFYLFNIQVLDDGGKLLAQGRDLAALKTQWGHKVRKTLEEADSTFERDNITRWDFGDLPRETRLKRNGMRITAYPYMKDERTSVALKIDADPQLAHWQNIQGVARLTLLEASVDANALARSLLKGRDLGLTVLDLGNRQAVIDDLLLAAALDACFAECLPQTEEAFRAGLSVGRGRLAEYAKQREDILADILSQAVTIRKTIKNSRQALLIAHAAGDIQEQMRWLLRPGFLLRTPLEWLSHYPRYLKAILVRLEKAAGQVQKDKLATAEIQELLQPWQDRVAAEGESHVLQNDDMVRYRWMCEELRVSLFAQTLKTAMPVSPKRIKRFWQEIK